MPGRKRGERVLGPYRHGAGWRVVEVAADGSRTRSQFASKKKAEIYAESLSQQLVASDHTTASALDAYEDHLKAKGNKEGSIDRTRWAVEKMFPTPVAMWALSAKLCKARYEAIAGGELAVDSHRNALAETKTFLEWCVERGFIGSNPAAEVKGTGKRRKKKAQLRIKEARQWYTVALRAASEGDDGALAALIALLLGMRASEITNLRVRDLDEDESPFDSLWIDDSKTEAGRRPLDVPEVLRPLLAAQAKGRKPDALLFPTRVRRGPRKGTEVPHWRDWPRENIQSLCKIAGVPRVTAHGMRGLLSTISLERGLAGHLVAATLGHEDVRTTLDSYAQRGAAESGARRRGVAKLLSFPVQEAQGTKKNGTKGI
jgi:integrase